MDLRHQDLQLPPTRPLLAGRVAVIIQVHGLIVVVDTLCQLLHAPLAPTAPRPTLHSTTTTTPSSTTTASAQASPRRSATAEPSSRAPSTPRRAALARAGDVAGVLALGLDHGLEGPVPVPLVGGGPGGLLLDAGDGGLDLGEGGVTPRRPPLQRGDDGGHGGGLDVPQGRDGRDLDDAAQGVQPRAQQAGVDGGDDDVLDLARGGEAEVPLQGGVRQVVLVPAEGQEGELAELERLGVVEGGEVGGGLVVGVEAVAEDLEVGEVGCVLRRVGKGLYLWRDEEVCEDVGGRG